MNRSLWILLCLVPACTAHISPHKNKRRKFDEGEYAAAPAQDRGSLFRDDEGGILEDFRARRIGDVVVIRIDEFDAAKRDAKTQLDRNASVAAGATAAMGLLSALPKDVSADRLLGVTSENKFDGQGKVQREGRLIGTLPVKVQRRLKNGDFFVEGTKVILVNDEEHHLYVSGIVRPQDIGPDNTVPSSRVADAEIEYFGNGSQTDTQHQGFLGRLFNKLWPF